MTKLLLKTNVVKPWRASAKPRNERVLWKMNGETKKRKSLMEDESPNQQQQQQLLLLQQQRMMDQQTRVEQMLLNILGNAQK